MAIDMRNQKLLWRYSKKDVTELAFKMMRYMEDISAEVPGAMVAYDGFIKETRNAERICSKVFLFLFTVNAVLSIDNICV